MKSTEYLLIGGGLASSQAAKQLRRDHPGASIVLVGGEPHLPYDRPPLSKEYLQGKKPRAELFYDAESYFTEHRIDVILGMTVEILDLTGKTATLRDGRTIRFEKSLIATGGRPVRLPIPGGDLPGVHYLRTIDDADTIAADAASGRRAVVIGGGFIGLELAASLTQRGVQVTVVETAAHIWPRFA